MRAGVIDDKPSASKKGTKGPLKWIVGVIVVLVGIVMFAAYEGAREQDRMRRALALTNYRVGMTEGQLYELGNKISATGPGTIGEAREVIFWMVCSGRFGSTSMEASAKVALRLVSTTGKSPKEAVALLIGMTERTDSDPFLLCPK